MKVKGLVPDPDGSGNLVELEFEITDPKTIDVIKNGMIKFEFSLPDPERSEREKELFENNLILDLGNTSHLSNGLMHPPYIGDNQKFSRGQYILQRLTALGYVIEKRR